MKNKNKNKIFIEDGIDIIKLLSKLLKKKILIIKISLIFLLFGILYSISIEDEYLSSTTFYPHYDNLEENRLEGLAGLAGININKQNNLTPNLYPQLIKSNDFRYKILNSEFIFNGNETSYKSYLLNKNKRSNLKKILFFWNDFNEDVQNLKLMNNEIKYITENDTKLFDILDEKISISINEKDGFIELSVLDNNPKMSALIAIKANELLQQSIIDFKLKNINDVYQFTSKQLDIAKKNLYSIQDSLATFKDKNISIKSDVFLNKLSRLETEFNISKNIYNQLALEKEKTAIDVKKNTPIFTIINSVYVP